MPCPSPGEEELAVADLRGVFSFVYFFFLSEPKQFSWDSPGRDGMALFLVCPDSEGGGPQGCSFSGVSGISYPSPAGPVQKQPWSDAAVPRLRRRLSGTHLLWAPLSGFLSLLNFGLSSPCQHRGTF